MDSDKTEEEKAIEAKAEKLDNELAQQTDEATGSSPSTENSMLPKKPKVPIEDADSSASPATLPKFDSDTKEGTITDSTILPKDENKLDKVDLERDKNKDQIDANSSSVQDRDDMRETDQTPSELLDVTPSEKSDKAVGTSDNVPLLDDTEKDKESNKFIDPRAARGAIVIDDEVQPIIPKRYVLLFLLFLGFAVIYALRVNINVAIVAMVNNKTLITKTGRIVQHVSIFISLGGFNTFIYPFV